MSNVVSDSLRDAFLVVERDDIRLERRHEVKIGAFAEYLEGRPEQAVEHELIRTAALFDSADLAEAFVQWAQVRVSGAGNGEEGGIEPEQTLRIATTALLDVLEFTAGRTSHAANIGGGRESRQTGGASFPQA